MYSLYEIENKVKHIVFKMNEQETDKCEAEQ